MSGKRIAVGVVGLVVVSGLVGAACGASDGSGGAGLSAPTGAGLEGSGMVVRGEPAPADAAGEGVEAGAGGDGGAGLFAVPAIGARIIKTASLSVQVRKGTFDGRIQEITLIASRRGGFVASSETVTGKSRSGTMVLRVPAAEFEGALADLRRLGRVTSQRISGRDVTAEYVDLQARLRNWQAQEVVLLRLMQRAETIDETITVQRQLQEVQLAIEQIKGQLGVLDDQTELATISLSVAEAGFVPPNREAPTSLGRAWDRAVEGFLAVIAAVMIGLGYVVPLALIGLAMFLGWSAYRRSRTRPAPAS